MRNEEFIQKRLLNESKKLREAGFIFPTFLLVSQGIETLGAFIDKKPIAVKAQSKKRFHLAIEQLFPQKYQDLTKNDWLYKQLRCNLSHMCSGGGFIVFSTDKEKLGTHLALINGKRLFLMEALVNDFQKACTTLIVKLEKGELKQKAMALS
tara:strand:+ start:143 stop:598 length:456 start_codon:yes stop_codon:yes gene_type:complete